MSPLLPNFKLLIPFKQVNMTRHITTVAMGIISGLIIHLYLLTSEGLTYSQLKPTGIVGFVVIGILTAYLVHYISITLNELIAWQNSPGKRLMAGIVINTILTFLIFWVGYHFSWAFLIDNPSEQTVFGQLGIIKLGVIVGVIIFIFSIIYYALYSYTLFGKIQIQETQLQRELVETQLKTLKGQLTPHFLFNSLNTISSLVHRESNEAEIFIRRLAKTYQYTLENYQKTWVPITDEIEIVQSYFYMMKTRFGNVIDLNIEIPGPYNQTKVLPLSIQSLVENALKHNRIDQASPLVVLISVDQDYITISNNKTGTPKKVVSHNIGLSNLKKRYSMILEKEIEVLNQDDRFTVKIPTV